MGSPVGLVKVGSSEEEIKDSIGDALDLIDFKPKGLVKSVDIKPNLCYYWQSSTGYTTDPHLVGALIDCVRERYGRDIHIRVVEADATAMKTKHAFKMLGYEKLAQDYNVELTNLSEDKNDTVEVTAGEQSFNLRVPQTIQKADLKINIPKIKYTVENIKLTCALKNIFGCNPYPKKVPIPFQTGRSNSSHQQSHKI